MSKCTAQIFSGITAAMWQQISQQATDNGLPIEGNSGRKTKDGFEVSWDFDPASGRLELQCHNSPFWAPCSLIQEKVEEIVKSCRC